jgi:hypothetical protein
MMMMMMMRMMAREIRFHCKRSASFSNVGMLVILALNNFFKRSFCIRVFIDGDGACN